MSEKILVIAEKPSVAQDIVRALTPVAGKFDKHEDYFENDAYVVTSAVGHLVEIKAPDAYEVKRGKWSFAHLPVIPPEFALEPVAKSKARLAAVVKLIKRKDVGMLVNACDAGREGELIFRLIVQYAKSDKPVKRLWLQSMTPQAIREGFEHLRSDSQMQPLAAAARSRSEADWLVGINGTRAMTAFNSRDGGFFLTTVGRVQTPTLAVVVEREEKIRKFAPRNYWEVHAIFGAQAGEYAGKWFNPEWKKGADEHDRADRLWDKAQAVAIASAVEGQTGTVREESKPATKASPLLFDLTSLQREANNKFGFSAKTTLALAQALYERHKVLTYPRTDSRALPEDYLGVVKATLAAIGESVQPQLAPFAKEALAKGYVKPTRRVFDNAKVSDHFAIIPTQQMPGTLTDAERKLYDLVARRFMAVFFPSAEYLVTTRTTLVGESHFRTEGRVLVAPGWLAIYGKDADVEEDGAKDGGKSLVPVKAGELVRAEEVEVKDLQTKPPARFTEATLLGAMEGAGKAVDDEELRAAMQDKGLGTPATRAAIIEGLITEKYLLREGRELLPTAKAFQLLTLLRGLGVDELSKPELTGEWEHKLSQMEKGRLSRDEFMQEIAQMTQHIVKKAKEYDRDSVPGDYATLTTPCPNCGGVVKENYRRFVCTGADGESAGCGFSISKIPGGRSFELDEVEALLRDKRIGPLQGFRSKAGWPFAAELKLVKDTEINNWKLEFDFGADQKKDDGEPVEAADFSEQTSLGKCPKCGGGVFAWGSSYVCEHAVPTVQAEKTTCDFKTGRIILQQPIEPAQVTKLLETGKTDLLDGFVSNKTRRKFKAYLVWDEKTGKVGFAFEPRKGAAARSAAGKTTAKKNTAEKAPAKKVVKKTATKKTATKKTATKKAPTKKNGN